MRKNKSISVIGCLALVSTLGMFSAAGNRAQRLAPMSDIHWERASPYGIEYVASEGAWWAGRVTDVLITGSGTLLAATEAGGVWDIVPGTTAISLSNDWDVPDVTCLAQGPNGNDHVYAGCGKDDLPTTRGALYETDLTRTAPLAAPWRSIPLLVDGKDIMGSVYQIVVSKAGPSIVLACSGGLFWSVIPKAGGDYSWQSADGVPSASFYGLALSAKSTIVAARWDASSTPIYYGTWKYIGTNPVSLQMNPARISGVDPSKMTRTSLAASNSQPNIVYALSANPRIDCPPPPCGNTPLAVLRSTKRGKKWVATAGVVDGLPDDSKPWSITNPGITGDVASGGNIHNITVSPGDPDFVAFGWLHSFISSNGGDNWTELPQWPHSHDDVHKIYFDPRDDTNQTYYIASDGGLAGTTDKGKTFSSSYNEKLPNLEFYSTLPIRNFYGRMFASYNVAGLIGGGLQDSGNVYCKLDGVTPWRRTFGCDGGVMISLRPGNILETAGCDPNLADAVWDGSELTKRGDAPVKDAGGAVIAGGLSAAIEIVNSPVARNGFGQLMYAVAGVDGTFYGVFASGDGSDTHFEQVAAYPRPLGEQVTAVGSATGERVFAAVAGPAGAHFFIVSPSRNTVEPTGPLPAGLPTDGAVTRVVVQDDGLVYATYNYGGGNGVVLRTRNAGQSWEQVGSGLPNEFLYGMDTDWTTSSKNMYVDTDDRVYASTDGGDTWQNVSSGLPRRVHGADMRFVTQPDGSHYLYLATYGSSMWRALVR